LKHVDFLIAGQGMAGTFLSQELLKSGRSVLVVDDFLKECAGLVGAGICNPITGMRFVKTWKSDEIFPNLAELYAPIESLLNQKFFFKKDIIRVLKSEEEAEIWQKKLLKNDYGNFADTTTPIPDVYKNLLTTPHGAFFIRNAGWADMSSLIKSWREFLKSKELFIEGEILVKDIKILDDGIEWKGIFAKKIIFCGGWRDSANPFFQYVEFQPTKGEVLTLVLKDFPEDFSISSKFFILPIGDGIFRAGASNDWDNLNEIPTEFGKQEILEGIQSFLKTDIEIIDHKAGIRPALKDRHPYYELHHDIPQLGIFNGLGAKGASLAPYLAKKFSETLLKIF
jgi:glycine/D-amino acid oxidase-like deaminating enzyme